MKKIKPKPQKKDDPPWLSSAIWSVLKKWDHALKIALKLCMYLLSVCLPDVMCLRNLLSQLGLIMFLLCGQFEGNLRSWSTKAQCLMPSSGAVSNIHNYRDTKSYGSQYMLNNFTISFISVSKITNISPLKVIGGKSTHILCLRASTDT